MSKNYEEFFALYEVDSLVFHCYIRNADFSPDFFYHGICSQIIMVISFPFREVETV